MNNQLATRLEGSSFQMWVNKKKLQVLFVFVVVIVGRTCAVQKIEINKMPL